jgi:xanthine dehydrogenase accessory factor
MLEPHDRTSAQTLTQPPTQPLADDAFDWTVFGLADDVRPALRRAADQGAPAALATLYAVEGGAPPSTA